jgi:hypothetical protein
VPSRSPNRDMLYKEAGNSLKHANHESGRMQIGLCADCHFMRRIESDRGSVFHLCGRSVNDPQFPKYPKLPVLQCEGYDPKKGREKQTDDTI